MNYFMNDVYLSKVVLLEFFIYEPLDRYFMSLGPFNQKRGRFKKRNHKGMVSEAGLALL